MSAPSASVQHDAAGSRFTILLEGSEAVLQYRRSGKEIDLCSTFVPEELRGQGLAERLAKAAFEYAKSQHLAVRPSCSYISGAYLKRHPEYLPLTQGLS
jgi:predicted GNAT family acetyltransferase